MAPIMPPRPFLTSPKRKTVPADNSQPRTPSPPSGAAPMPLRYPETLDLLIEVQEAEGKGKGVFVLCDSKCSCELLFRSELHLL